VIPLTRKQKNEMQKAKSAEEQIFSKMTVPILKEHLKNQGLTKRRKPTKAIMMNFCELKSEKYLTEFDEIVEKHLKKKTNEEYERIIKEWMRLKPKPDTDSVIRGEGTELEFVLKDRNSCVQNDTPISLFPTISNDIIEFTRTSESQENSDYGIESKTTTFTRIIGIAEIDDGISPFEEIDQLKDNSNTELQKYHQEFQTPKLKQTKKSKKRKAPPESQQLVLPQYQYSDLYPQILPQSNILPRNKVVIINNNDSDVTKISFVVTYMGTIKKFKKYVNPSSLTRERNMILSISTIAQYP